MAILTFWCKNDDAGLKKTVKTVMPKLAPVVDWRIIEHKVQKVVYPDPDELVLGMGSDIYEELKYAGVVPKNRAVTGQRGKLFTHTCLDNEGQPVGVGHWMVSFSPALANMEADKAGQIIWDIRLAHRYLTTQSLQPPVGTYAYTTTLKYVQEYVRQSYEAKQKPIQVSLDLETMGFHPWYPEKKIVTVQVTVAEGVADVINMMDPHFEDPKNLSLFLSELRTLLNDPRVALIGANLKFDLNWIRVKWGLECTNFRLDTTIVGSLLNENRSNGLNWHAKEHTAIGGYDDPFASTADKGKMEKEIVKDPEGFLIYAGGDTDAAYRIADYMKEELRQQPILSRFYTKVLHPAARAFEKIEHRGLVVDLDKFQQLELDLMEEMAKWEKVALQMIPGRIRARYADDLSLTRGTMIRDFLFSPAGLNLKPLMVTDKKQDPQINKAHLMLFADHEVAGPFIKAYSEWSKCGKFLGTYVRGFLAHLRPDGRFHPTYMLFAGAMFDDTSADDSGTVTGRLAAKEPAMQTVPKHDKVWAPRLRACFPAPPGMVFWSADYSQGELRITACLANEETMLAAYKAGLDLHAVTGASMAGYELDEFLALNELEEGSEGKSLFAKFRNRAKPANFGLLYGMQAPGFREYARTAYGLKLSAEEAEGVRNKFFETYPGLVAWHEDYIDFARRNEWVVSPLGRVRHLPLINSKNWQLKSEAERQAINSPVQGCLSDMNIWAAALLEADIGGEDKLWIAGATHDNLYGYVNAEHADYYLGRVKEIMSTLPLKSTMGWNHQIDFPVDLEVGTNMSDCKKYVLPA